MRRETVDVLVLGAGAAGLAAASAAAEQGANVSLIDREEFPGGVLDQCIHPGFGLHRYQQELTGPEFAHRMVAEVTSSGAAFHGSRYACCIHPEDHTVDTLGPTGRILFKPTTVVLATGARERPFGALAIPSFRPSGILTAGVAQRLVNIDGVLPGKRAIVLGSGDIGLIMARRLHLEGVEVVAVLEQRPFPGGLLRNVVQCLEDFEIPLLLKHTVSCVHGTARLKGVTMVETDDFGAPVPGTEEFIEADTLVLSVGLIPDNELVMEMVSMDQGNGGLRVDSQMRTDAKWLFAAGNNVVVYDLADWVADAGETAGRHAAKQALGEHPTDTVTRLVRGPGVLHMVPAALTPGGGCHVLLRVDRPIVRGRLTIGNAASKVLHGARPSEMIEWHLSEDQVHDLCRSTEVNVEVTIE